jgi:hypothetical protein
LTLANCLTKASNASEDAVDDLDKVLDSAEQEGRRKAKKSPLPEQLLSGMRAFQIEGVSSKRMREESITATQKTP